MRDVKIYPSQIKAGDQTQVEIRRGQHTVLTFTGITRATRGGVTGAPYVAADTDYPSGGMWSHQLGTLTYPRGRRITVQRP